MTERNSIRNDLTDRSSTSFVGFPSNNIPINEPPPSYQSDENFPEQRWSPRFFSFLGNFQNPPHREEPPSWNDFQYVETFQENGSSTNPPDENLRRQPTTKKSIQKRFGKIVRRLLPMVKNSKNLNGNPQVLVLPPVPIADFSEEEKRFELRYKDRSSMKTIELQDRPLTQPTDLCVLKETKKIFVCDVGRSVIEIFDFQGNLEHVIDSPTMLNFFPTTLTVAFDGTIVSASYFTNGLLMYLQTDEAHQHFQRTSNLSYDYKPYQLGSQGKLIHQFFQPGGITLDPSDSYLYICDRGNMRIKVLTPRGVCERTIELFDGNRTALEPISIAFQSTSDMLVCLIAADSICFVPKSSNGETFVETSVVVDDRSGGLQNPTGIAVDGEGRIFIADTSNHRIVICRPNGNFLMSFGGQGTSIGCLNRPCGIDLMEDGTIVVADSGNRRIHLFGIAKQQEETNVAQNQQNSVVSNDERIEENQMFVAL